MLTPGLTTLSSNWKESTCVDVPEPKNPASLYPAVVTVCAPVPKEYSIAEFVMGLKDGVELKIGFTSIVTQ